ncbi:MAG: trypsin-like peptidase domain-containing protein [Janthinobacterium lividum]
MSRRTFTLLMAGCVLTAGSAQAAPKTAGNLPVPTTPQQKSALVQLQDAFTGIAQTVEPTVVNIKAERLRSATGDGEDGPAPKSGQPAAPHRLEATGSGVIVRADGYILTNDHVVEDASGGTVMVTLADGREFSGKVYPDSPSDLAIVKIDPGPIPLPVAGFADDAAVRPGQWAIAIGSPFDLQNTMTVGVISAIGRHQSIGSDSTARYYPDLIQTDAAINPGNSGGPLFNIDGKVVGINVAIESPVEGSAGVGFAIPSDIAQTVMNALIQSHKVTRGYLGIAPEDLTPALQTEYGQKDGAFVRDVKLDSPAGKAGLQAGDIVTAYNGAPVHGEVSLRETISATLPGRTISLDYVRDGRAGTASVTLGTSPILPDDDASNTQVFPVPKSVPINLGFSVRSLGAADRQILGLPAATRGVLITDVDAGSPAEAAGFTAGLTLTGAVIQKIGRQTITTKFDYERVMASLSTGSSTALVLLYTSHAQTHQTVLTLQP